MTIHVNIGEAKSRLSQLIAAAKRGEKVVIDRDGEPEVELTPVVSESDKERRRKHLQAFLGSRRGAVTPRGLDLIAQPSFSDEELDDFLKSEI